MKRLLLLSFFLTLLGGCSNSNITLNEPEGKEKWLSLECSFTEAKVIKSSSNNVKDYSSDNLNSLINDPIFIIQDNLVNISRTKIGISKEYQLGISNFREPSNIIPKNFDIINYSSDSIVLRQKNPELFMYLIEISINRKNGEIIWHKRSFKDINQHWIKGKCKNNKNMF